MDPNIAVQGTFCGQGDGNIYLPFLGVDVINPYFQPFGFTSC